MFSYLELTLVKDNFLKAREFTDLTDLQIQSFLWQEEVANQPVHATTKARPVDLFKMEKQLIVPLDSALKYYLSLRRKRTVNSEGLVSISGSHSCPPEMVGQKVVVE